MFKSVLAAAIALGLAAVSVPMLARTYVAAGTSEDSVNKGISVESGVAVKDLESVNGSIDLGDRARATSIESVNGEIDLGAGVEVGSIETVNGAIDAGPQLRVSGSLESVNGSIELDAGAVIGGSIETVNGTVDLDQAHIARNLETVNGRVATNGGSIEGDVETVNGSVELMNATHLSGNLFVRKPQGSNWSWGTRKAPLIVIGAGSTVGGKIVLEQEARLFVHESARVGAIEGGEATTFSGERPDA